VSKFTFCYRAKTFFLVYLGSTDLTGSICLFLHPWPAASGALFSSVRKERSWLSSAWVLHCQSVLWLCILTTALVASWQGPAGAPMLCVLPRKPLCLPCHQCCPHFPFLACFWVSPSSLSTRQLIETVLRVWGS
jgi:hypothetical protein